jgi:hypothetical protein
MLGAGGIWFVMLFFNFFLFSVRTPQRTTKEYLAIVLQKTSQYGGTSVRQLYSFLVLCGFAGGRSLFKKQLTGE